MSTDALERIFHLLAELDRLEQHAAAIRAEIRRHLRDNGPDPSHSTLRARFEGTPI